MDIDVGELMASLLVSSIGFVAFAYGKRQGRVPQLLTGLVLMIYPYFVHNIALMLGIATALVALMWGAIRYGW